MKPIDPIKPHYTYRNLPDVFFKDQNPIFFNHASFSLFNDDLSTRLNLDKEALKTTDGLKFLLGQHDSLRPLSMAYAGHQYGNFTILGDGRAHLITEHYHEGTYYDIHLKGSGPTPYSRGFDGRATLRSALLEYLMSTALNALNIPTTETLAVIKTGDQINRIGLQDAAVLVRVAQSHLRVGTFEYAVYKDSDTYLKPLIDYAMKRHDKDLLDSKDNIILWYKRVIKRQAELVAKWQSVGFVHGVMNTDNMTISGETIDFGPCAFIDDYDLKSVYSSIDTYGRYAFGNQPYIASWNLAKLGQMILPLVSEDKPTAIKRIQEALDDFSVHFESHFYHLMTDKIGIEKVDKTSVSLVDQLLSLMEKLKLDYTETFLHLTYEDNRYMTINDRDFFIWKNQWLNRLKSEEDPIKRMQKANPIIIPRNILVKEILDEAVNKNDLTHLITYINHLKNPFNPLIPKRYRKPKTSKEAFVTYCGT